MIKLLLKIIGAKKAVGCFGTDPGVLEFVTEEEFLNVCDIDVLLEEIENMFPGKMSDFLTDYYSE